MTPNWLPIRCDLHVDPAVIAIANATGTDEFCVVGRLVRLWSWANEQLPNGNAVGVTTSWIDRYLYCPGFAAAMIAAGWLEQNEYGVAFPKFEVWNSQGAKIRKVTARRVERHRAGSNAKSNAGTVTGETPDALPRERERVESKDPPNPPEGGTGVPAKMPRQRKQAAAEHRHFAAFWSAYPRKEARSVAAKAFAKIDPGDELLAAMLAALEVQKRSPKWTKDNGEYINHPATWLNQRRWEDQPPEVGKAAPATTGSGLPYDDYTNYIPKPGA